jgi:hypothetical protein
VKPQGQAGARGAAAPPEPELSIVVASTGARESELEDLGRCLESIAKQSPSVRAEVIVAARCERPGGLAPESPGLRWLCHPGATVFQLRARAIREARGAVVAVTEDHCRVALDWSERILAAHREWANAVAIGGAVENGSDGSLLDWANFFVTNGASAPPLRRGPHRRVALQANVSYKREFAPRAAVEEGYQEWRWNEDLRREGHVLVADDSIVVTHVQSFPWRRALAIHFHDARTVAAFRSRKAGPIEIVARTAIAMTVMAPLLVLRAVLAVAPKRRHTGTVAAALPWISALCLLRSLGAFAGFTTGAGPSAHEIY